MGLMVDAVKFNPKDWVGACENKETTYLVVCVSVIDTYIAVFLVTYRKIQVVYKALD